jgi:hypothetical protein
MNVIIDRNLSVDHILWSRSDVWIDVGFIMISLRFTLRSGARKATTSLISEIRLDSAPLSSATSDGVDRKIVMIRCANGSVLKPRAASSGLRFGVE